MQHGHSWELHGHLGHVVHGPLLPLDAGCQLTGHPGKLHLHTVGQVVGQALVGVLQAVQLGACAAGPVVSACNLLLQLSMPIAGVSKPAASAVCLCMADCMDTNGVSRGECALTPAATSMPSSWSSSMMLLSSLKPATQAAMFQSSVLRLMQPRLQAICPHVSRAHIPPARCQCMPRLCARLKAWQRGPPCLTRSHLTSQARFSLSQQGALQDNACR